jgi:hypothetical protein
MTMKKAQMVSLLSSLIAVNHDVYSGTVRYEAPIELCRICGEECPRNKICCSSEHFKIWKKR